ncbi:hypothetical protein [Streptomyces sp. NPDC059010]|uniref:hypothetical protein n=1 Tax=Streptomyces sp. NPDC059010 TaxID=3346695 RepID=UPI0036A183E0
MFAGAGVVATGLDVVMSASGLADELTEHERADDVYRTVLDHPAAHDFRRAHGVFFANARNGIA